MKPVVVGTRKLEVGGGIHVQRGRDVDHAQALHPRRVVQRQPVRHAAAPVMAAHVELRHAQRVHHRHHVLRHRAFAVGAVVWPAGRLGRVAVAAQIGHDQKKRVV